MLNTTIYVDEAEVKKRLGALADQSGRVIARAANRSYTTGKTAIAREAKKDYLVTQKDVNSTKVLKITKATASNPTATLDYTGQHRNLFLWNNKKAVTPSTRISWRGGRPNVKIYRAAVQRGHGKTKLSGENKPFIQRVRSGENGEFVGLFRRKTTSRDSALVGVGASAIPQILKNDRIISQFNNSAGPMFQKRLEHEIEMVLKGAVK
jgi:hypothetical protein